MWVSATYICPVRGCRALNPLSRRFWPGLEKTGLLDQGGDPKKGVEALIRLIRSEAQRRGITEFIDIDQKEYLENPDTHLRRLWDHFREATG
jgi:hypothetical protein